MKKRLLGSLIVVTSLFFGSMTVFAAPTTMPDGGTFDPEFYASTYPDVKAAFGTDANLLYQHYLTAGKAEGRLPYAQGSQTQATASTAPATSGSLKTMPDGGLFDAAFYAATYPDVAAAFGNNEALLYQHYLTAGKAEGRLPYAAGTVEEAPAVAAPTAQQPATEQLQGMLQQIEAVRQEMLHQNVLLQKSASVAETNQHQATINELAQQMLTLDSQITQLQGGIPTYTTNVCGMTAILPYVYRADDNVILFLSLSGRNTNMTGFIQLFSNLYLVSSKFSGDYGWYADITLFNSLGEQVDFDTLYAKSGPQKISSTSTYTMPNGATVIRTKAN